MKRKEIAMLNRIEAGFSILFAVILCVFLLLSCIKFLPVFLRTIPTANSLHEAIAQTESLFDDSIFARRYWMNIYGGYQRLLLKNEINHFEVIKDKEGFLHLLTEEIGEDTIAEYADNLTYFHQLCQINEIPFLYIAAPSDVVEGVTSLPIGITDYSNRNIDCFLQKLDEKKIPYLDLRTILNGMRLEDIFYKTDHHWALPMAFESYKMILEMLNNKYGMELDKDSQYRNLDNYELRQYPNSFLGSIGVKTGEFYTGKDLFRILVPTFETDLVNQYFVGSKLEWVKEGTFWEAMIQEDILLDSFYYNKYNVFMNGSSYESRIQNNSADNNYRCLLISDSFGRQIIPYLSLCFHETRWLDPQIGRYRESYTDYIEEYQPDCVLIMFNGKSCYFEIPK